MDFDLCLQDHVTSHVYHTTSPLKNRGYVACSKGKDRGNLKSLNYTW